MNKTFETETSRIEISEETGLIVSVECFEKIPEKEPAPEDIKPEEQTPGVLSAMTEEEKAAFDAA